VLRWVGEYVCCGAVRVEEGFEEGERVCVKRMGNALQHTATHCNTLQHTATHCNTLQHTATPSWEPTLIIMPSEACGSTSPTLQPTLHHTATHCNTIMGADINNNAIQGEWLNNPPL